MFDVSAWGEISGTSQTECAFGGGPHDHPMLAGTALGHPKGKSTQGVSLSRSGLRGQEDQEEEEEEKKGKCGD